MRFNVIDKDNYTISGIRNDLERMLNAIIIDESENIDNKFFQPLTEIRENNQEYQIKLQLPGIKKEDIEIELDNNIITISAEHKFEEIKNNESIISSQFRYGKFQKTIELEKEIDSENSECELIDGILNIILKKQEEKKSSKKLFIK